MNIMAKRSFRGKPKKSKPKLSQNNIMQQFNEMQAQMEATQAKLADELFTVTAAGGALSVSINGAQRLTEIKVDPELMDEDDPEMLTDLLVSTINQAIEKSQKAAADQMEGVTGGMGMGDLLGGLGL